MSTSTSNNGTTNYAVILAAGSGERMGFSTPKQFLKLAGRTVIEHTLAVFQAHPQIHEIFIVVSAKDRLYLEELLLKNPVPKVTKLLNGGATRKDSSWAGICAVPSDRLPNANLLMHDAVRPFVTRRIISETIDALGRHAAVDVAVPAVDTIVSVDGEDFIRDIPDRSALRRGQTPQGFRAAVLKKAHELSHGDPHCEVTDDCKLILNYNLGDIYVVRGEEKNIKITYPEDLFLADKIFQVNSSTLEDGPPLRRVQDKVVAVFGATKGIGEALMFLGREYGGRMHGFAASTGCDVSDAEAVERALAGVLQAEGRIDAVVNTAGVLRSGRLADRDPADIEREIAVNYLGSINVVRAALPHLEATRGGICLFTSSSFTRGRSLYSVYSSTKAAIVNLVQGIAEETAPQGVRINAINPERTATPMRVENFGPEPPESLLTAREVAEATIKTLFADFSGTVVDVRRKSATL
ncbi:2-C-methyl-D-erythritol 4-phosphate cytidylyltransferase [Paucidesulfovibrio longus]|uniref:2-C-methyl-D-erythritol 4-phosphate cytidylyltransferase n=1 Tax=Paucidesulfovibrio longus TaxID=889 RepID=UPI0003B59FF3|nr:2-C-methyl-D-erythritol 4-phosphate cytidylyltransferase [Paucidesulfovibrio longus]